MILSRGRRYVFVHIPKTAGTAMALALESRAMRDDMMLGDTPKARKRRRRLAGVTARGRLWKHATLADIDGLVTPEELGALFAFTLVRNPWDRAVSYYHWLRTQRFDHPAVDRAQTLEFEGFTLHPDTRATVRAWPAARYMQRADGVEQCQAYIRIEQFAQDATPLWAHLGFRLELDRVNASPRSRDYRPFFSDAAAEAIAQDCALDISRFGYGFDQNAADCSGSVE